MQVFSVSMVCIISLKFNISINEVLAALHTLKVISSYFFIIESPYSTKSRGTHSCYSWKKSVKRSIYVLPILCNVVGIQYHMNTSREDPG